MTSAREAAALYVARGWRLVRIAAREKRPMSPGWPNLTVAANDVAAGENIGVILGTVSGHLVDVDLDCPEAIALASYILPATASFGRASARRSHWLYYAQGAVTERLEDASGDVLVELRADKPDGTAGVQTVFPGSVHPSGEPVEWESGLLEVHAIHSSFLRELVARLAIGALLVRGGTPEKYALVACKSPFPVVLPDDVAKLAHRWLGWPLPAPAVTVAAPRPASARQSADALSRASAYLARIPGAVSGSGGHQQTWDAACALVRGFALGESDALSLLASEYNPRCEPPWSERELRHKVTSAAADGRLPLGYLRDAERPGAAVRSVPMPTTAHAAEDWPTPELPEAEPELPSFPVYALPEALRDWVTALAEHTQTPPDMAAMLSLSACAAAVAGRAEVVLANGHREPLCLYTVTVLPPGERKSAVAEACAAPLRAWEAKRVAETKADVARAATRIATVQRRIVGLQTEAAKARTKADRERIEAEIDDAAEELAGLPPAVSPRLLADDATPEALTSLLAAHGRIAIFSAEGGVFSMMAGQYSDAPSLDVYLKGHSGDTIRVDRKGRGPESIDRPTLTLGLAIQPEVLDQIAATSHLRGTGLLARFLYSLPPSRLGSRKVIGDALPEAVRARYEQVLGRMLIMQRLPRPIAMPLSTGAAGIWTAFAAEVEPGLAEYGVHAAIRDWAAKLPGAVNRIAGILRAVRVYGAAHPLDLAEPSTWEVDADSMAGAVLIARSLIPHAARALQRAVVDEQDAAEERFVRWLRRTGRSEFSAREAYRSLCCHRCLSSMESIEATISALTKRAILRPCSAVAKRPGRPASPRYEVNPGALRNA